MGLKDEDRIGDNMEKNEEKGRLVGKGERVKEEKYNEEDRGPSANEADRGRRRLDDNEDDEGDEDGEDGEDDEDDEDNEEEDYLPQT